MRNIFRFFLYSLVALVAFGCEQTSEEIDCEDILEKAYSASSLNNFEKNKFKDLLKNRYPEFDVMFEEAAKETKLEKNLLAAISFQESQWDPKAISNMGVRGMMMVTLETAALVGVEKRLDPEQNIKGGAKYFAILKEKNMIGPTEADSLAATLASYNLGPTNMINIASQINEDISLVTWIEIQNKLKTMKGSELNLTDKGSYTRAQQALDYVDRVKDYYLLLSAHSCIAPKDQLSFF